MGIGLIQPPAQWVLGALSPGVKRPGREAYHSRLVPRLRMLILVNSVKSCLLCVVLKYLSSHVTIQLYGTTVLSWQNCWCVDGYCFPNSLRMNLFISSCFYFTTILVAETVYRLMVR